MFSMRLCYLILSEQVLCDFISLDCKHNFLRVQKLSFGSSMISVHDYFTQAVDPHLASAFSLAKPRAQATDLVRSCLFRAFQIIL